MEVILREDVPSLGKAGQLVKVTPGYARNFLFPKQLAFEATEGNKKRIAAETKAKAARIAADKAAAQALAQQLGALPLTIRHKAGDEGRLFGSVTAHEIADAVKAKGIDLDKRRIELHAPIRTVGFHSVPVKLHADVHAELKVTVVAE
jgi:large subunit ribosomal protein L9